MLAPKTGVYRSQFTAMHRNRDRAAKSKFSLLAADDLAAPLSAHVGAEPP